MQNKIEVLMFVLAVVVLLVAIGVGPLLTLWSINALFGLGIAYNFWNWLAVAWLNLATFGGLSMAIRSLKQE